MWGPYNIENNCDLEQWLDSQWRWAKQIANNSAHKKGKNEMLYPILLEYECHKTQISAKKRSMTWTDYVNIFLYKHTKFYMQISYQNKLQSIIWKFQSFWCHFQLHIYVHASKVWQKLHKMCNVFFFTFSIQNTL